MSLQSRNYRQRTALGWRKRFPVGSTVGGGVLPPPSSWLWGDNLGDQRWGDNAGPEQWGDGIGPIPPSTVWTDSDVWNDSLTWVD